MYMYMYKYVCVYICIYILACSCRFHRQWRAEWQQCGLTWQFVRDFTWSPVTHGVCSESSLGVHLDFTWSALGLHLEQLWRPSKAFTSLRSPPKAFKGPTWKAFESLQRLFKGLRRPPQACQDLTLKAFEGLSDTWLRLLAATAFAVFPCQWN